LQFHAPEQRGTAKDVLPVSGPTIWNSLPLSVRDPSLTLTQFCVHLKTETVILQNIRNTSIAPT